MAIHPLKPVLKRSALIAAANWQVTLIQAFADSLFKLVLAAPIVGGVFLVALAVGSEPSELISLGLRQIVTLVASSLLFRPVVLTALVLSVAVASVGGSLFVFLIKAGTIATLVRSDRAAGPIEEPPLRVSAVARASRFSVDSYVESARDLFPRYARLGLVLMSLYVVSAVGYLALVLSRDSAGGWGQAALITVGFVFWITLLNLLYLLIQIVMAADNCGMASAARRVVAFLRHERRRVATVFLLVLGLVIAATGASLLATAALGLVAFVPFLGLTALPLQLLAWLLRGLVFQYLGLTSVGAYLRLYRAFASLGRSSDAPLLGYIGSSAALRGQ